MRETVRRRSPNIGPEVEEQILAMIDGWVDYPLTWSALLAELSRRTGLSYRRQTLHRHKRIAAAFAQRRSALLAAPRSRPTQGSVELQKAKERIKRLTATVERLEAENRRLIDQFVVWAYNANALGLDEQRLNRPIPPAARARRPQ